MKQIILLLVLPCFISQVLAQENQWAWMQGDVFPQIPVYGIKGTSTPTTKPGARRNGTIWIDTLGNTWTFGGLTSSFLDYDLNKPLLNDLWKYMPSTGQWSWVSGDSTYNRTGIYGIKGLAAGINTPGARSSAVNWIDRSGNLWLFGGTGYAASGYGDLNDLWKYTPSTGQWTWVNGDSTVGRRGVYGVKGLAAVTNIPGARHGAVLAPDAAGDLWLYGGFGNNNSTVGYLNDLWKYTSTTGLWTWISGDSTKGEIAVYGAKGIAAPGNQPDGKVFATGSIDASGNLWLFSGYSYRSTTNDLWKYTVSSGLWTWICGDSVDSNERVSVYGTKGVAAAANMPGPRISPSSWADRSGNLWLFGGYGRSIAGFRGRSGWFNDLWKYTPSSGLWTWMSGDNEEDGLGVHGTKGLAAPGNKPGARAYANSCTDVSGNLWLFGGEGSSRNNLGNLNDLWKYTISTGEWTWISGDNNLQFNGGIYGIRGPVSPGNKPGGRYAASSWTDSSGNLWLFGGTGKSISNLGGLNDLWKYGVSTGQWTWMSGDSTVNSRSIYGARGIADTSTKPGARGSALSWTDASGNLWLFSGTTYDDLWKYSPSSSRWTWMSGDTSLNATRVYGTRGISAAANTPGARSTAVTWTDASGNLWLFGGSGRSSNEYKKFSDLWKYTPSTSQWTWMSGDSTAGEPGVYGSKGVAAPANKPGSRVSAVSWTDKAGDLWLFGGLGTVITDAEILNDLWKYSIATGQWTWVSGDNNVRQKSVYGTQGLAASTNKPGARFSSVSWTDASGALWLFGGNSTETYQNLNDFWKFTPATSQWTWMGGDSTFNAFGNYGIQGEYSPANKPAARNSAVGWTDKSGTLWLFGGSSNISDRVKDLFNDLWKFSTAAPALPPFSFSSFTALKQRQTILLNWTTMQEQNSRYYIIERSSEANLYNNIGSVAARNLSSPAEYAFIDLNPLTGTNYYRLKQIDQDGRFMYSGVAKVVMAENTAQFTIKQNPVQNILLLDVNLIVAQKLSIQVRDISGHLLLSKQDEGRAGTSVYSIQVGHLGSGTYLINVQSGAFNSIKTFVKQ